MKTTQTPNKVVLVIDNLDICNAIRDVLSTLDISVLTAVTAQEGIQLFQKYHANIALIILDIHRPDINGIETLSRLRGIDPKVRVILSSGFWDYTNHFNDLHVDGFLPKPYSMRQITTMVKPIYSPPLD